MLIQARDQLSTIFNSTPLFLFDAQNIYEIAVSRGLESRLIGDFETASSEHDVVNDVVFVISDRDWRATNGLSRLLKRCNVLQIPNYAFDSSSAASLYTLEKCGTLDLHDCIERNRRVLDELGKPRQHFSLESDRSTLTFSLFDDIRIMETATSDRMEEGMDHALSTYTEVALVPNAIDATHMQPSDLGYDANGSFECDGCLVAVHAGAPADLLVRKRRLEMAIDLLHQASEFPLRIDIVHSKFDRIATASGRDVTDIFVREMDELLGANVMELAVGTNAQATRSDLDWRHNSPINESALGFHLGLGDGARCPHVDFMCASTDSYNAFFDNRDD